MSTEPLFPAPSWTGDRKWTVVDWDTRPADRMAMIVHGPDRSVIHVLFTDEGKWQYHVKTDNSIKDGDVTLAVAAAARFLLTAAKEL